jgi:hypothetical protein
MHTKAPGVVPARSGHSNSVPPPPSYPSGHTIEGTVCYQVDTHTTQDQGPTPRQTGFHKLPSAGEATAAA